MRSICIDETGWENLIFAVVKQACVDYIRACIELRRMMKRKRSFQATMSKSERLRIINNLEYFYARTARTKAVVAVLEEIQELQDFFYRGVLSEEDARELLIHLEVVANTLPEGKRINPMDIFERRHSIEYKHELSIMHEFLGQPGKRIFSVEFGELFSVTGGGPKLEDITVT